MCRKLNLNIIVIIIVVMLVRNRKLYLIMVSGIVISVIMISVNNAYSELIKGEKKINV